MSSPQLNAARTQIDSWARSPERDLRVFSLVQAAHQAGDLPYDFLDELVARFSGDADATLAQHARALAAAVVARREREAERDHPGTVLAGLPAPALLPLGGVDARGRPLFEEAALYWLTPLLDRLHDAFESGALARSRLAEAIGHLGWRGSVSVLRGADKDPESADEVVEALARIGGDEAWTRLIELANDSAFPARVAALGKLGACPQPKAGAVLTAASKKSDPETRRQVARALATSKLPEVRTLLPKLLNDVDDVAIEAIHAMGRQRDSLFGAHLVSLGDKTRSTRVRATAVATLAGFAGPQVAVYVRNAAQDKDARVRANAVESAGRFLVNPQQARDFYRSLLQDPSHRVAANAVVALFPLDEPAALERLDFMLASSDARIRAAGCWAAGAARSEAARQRLSRSLERETDPKVLQAALRAIEGAADRAADRPTMDSLSRLAVFPRTGVRGLAAKAMARVGGLSVVPALAAMLSGETEAAVRREVVEALSEVPRMEALSYLPDLLSDANEGVVLGAVRALAATGTLEAAAHLRPMRLHAAAAVRTAATVSLVGLGDLEAIEGLGEALDSKKSADWALAAVCGIGDLLTVPGLARHAALPAALLRYHETTVAPREMRRPKVVAKQFVGPASKAGGKPLPKINIDIEKLMGSAPWEPQPQKPAGPLPADPFARPMGSGLFRKKQLEEAKKVEAARAAAERAAAAQGATQPDAAPPSRQQPPPPQPPPQAPAGVPQAPGGGPLDLASALEKIDPLPANGRMPRPVVSALASMPSIPRPGSAKAKAAASTASPLESLPPTPRGTKGGKLSFSALDDLLSEDDALGSLDDISDPLDGLDSMDDPLSDPAPPPPEKRPAPAPAPAKAPPAAPAKVAPPPAKAVPLAAPAPPAPSAPLDHHAVIEALLKSVYTEPAAALEQARTQLASHPADSLVRYLTMKARLTADRRVKLDELKQLASPGQSDMVAVPFQMARIYKEVKRPAETVTWYLDLLGIELSALERVRSEASRMAGLGHVDEAQKLVAYLSSVVPMRPRFHAEMGDACMKSGLPELAFHHLQRAHLSFPEDIALAFKLARAAQQIGEIAYCRILLDHVDVAQLPAEDHEDYHTLRRALSGEA